MPTRSPRSLIADLKRRRVFRTAVVYAIVGWVIVQVAATTFPALQLPDWALTLVVVLVALGFPLALALAYTLGDPADSTGRVQRASEPPYREAGDATVVEPAPGEPRIRDPADLPTSHAQAASVTTAPVDHSSGAPLGTAEATFSAEPTATHPTRTQPGSATPDSIRSLAVLPFVNMSSDSDNEYFSDGITEELLNALARIEGLRVPARTSSFALKGRNIDIREVGRILDVESVLEGSVRKAGNLIRITAQLIDVRNGYHLWSERYDRELSNIFEVQDDLTESIVRALRIRLNPREEQVIKRVPTENVQAYEYYLRGRQFLAQITGRAYEFSRQMFRRAVELDPTYAPAYAGLADASSFLFLHAEATRENLEEADRASARALELAPDLPEAHVARGLAVSLSKQYEQARSEYRRALELDPKSFDALFNYARSSWELGRREEAIEFFERAHAARPDDYQSLSLAVSLYDGLGRTEAAADAAQRALSVIERRLDLQPDDVRALYMGAICLSELGQPERAATWAQRAVGLSPEDPLVCYNVACFFSLQGDVEQAVHTLERAIQAGWRHPEWLDNDPDFNLIRDDPRFQEISERIKALDPT